MGKFLKTVGRIFLYVCLMAVLCLAGGLAFLAFFEHNVPPSILARLTDAVSDGDWIVRADAASFRFLHGVKIRNLRVFDRSKPAAPPVLSVARVDAELNLRRVPWARETLLKRLTLTDLSYPRLGDGYYIPDSIEFPGRPDFRERDEPLAFDLPELRPFRLTLVRPRILGLSPKLVDVPRVVTTAGTARAKDILLQWDDTDTLMTLDGECTLDLDAQLVHGFVKGQARQHNIRPMLVALDITNSYAFIDAFTKVERPVDAACRFDVNLRNDDLHLALDLHPVGGCYNKVPLKDVRGGLDIRVFVRDTFQNARIVVGPLAADLADGGALAGTVVYENTNDVGYVDFDARSTTSLSNALAVADVLNDGTLDCLVADTPPRVTLQGRLAVDPANAALNDLRGTVAFEKGSLFAVPLQAASAAFALRGTDVTFTDARATTPHGGAVTGGGLISLPGFDRARATFKVDVGLTDVALRDVADVFAFDLGDRSGTLNGTVSLAGPLATNATARLSGGGRLSCGNGHLAQMKVFAGLTSFLAKNVPGIASFVNQSRADMDFTIRNGVFRTENLHIDGGFFSIRAAGTYDIPADRLDFTARVTFTKNDGFFAKLATPITWPFANLTRMLFDFRIFGPLDDPGWKYNALR